MEWLKSVTDVAALPLQAILLIAVVVLYLENRNLRKQLVDILLSTHDTSVDNNRRIRRIEKDQLGDNSPTLNRDQVTKPKQE